MSLDYIRKMRGFELVEKYKDQLDLLPIRETKHAAGYDLKAAEDVVVYAGEMKMIPLGVKAYMQEDEVLHLYDRSSNPRKKGIVLMNSVGVIDSDYYNNDGNEGLLMALMYNFGDADVLVKRGDRIVQGVFQKFLKVDNDVSDKKRVGGFGSTD